MVSPSPFLHAHGTWFAAVAPMDQSPIAERRVLTRVEPVIPADVAVFGAEAAWRDIACAGLYGPAAGRSEAATAGISARLVSSACTLLSVTLR